MLLGQKIGSPARSFTVFVLLGVFMFFLVGCVQEAPPKVNQVEFTPNEQAVATLNSLEKVADNFYTMDYEVDYDLDAVLERGAKDEQDLEAFVSEQVLEGAPFHVDVPETGWGCSAFSAQTSEGDRLFGRNFDIAGAQNVLIRTQPEDGYRSLSIASGWLLGYLDMIPDATTSRANLLAAPYYPVDGINEKGLSVAMLLVYGAPQTNQDTGKTSITTTLAIRMLLDQAATVDEAVALLEQYDMYGISNANFHFLISDAEGESVVVEYVDGRLKVIESTLDWQVVTNFYLSPEAKEDYYDGYDNLIMLQAVLAANDGIITIEEAWNALEAVTVTDDYDKYTGINYTTDYSMLMNNTRKSLEICVNQDYETVFTYQVHKSSS